MVAFSIFGRDIYRYWIFYLISFILGYCFLYRIWKKSFFHNFPKLQNLIEKDLESLFIVLILWVLIWWRLWHVFIYDFHHFLNTPLDIFKVRQWRMSFIWWIIWVLFGVSILQIEKFIIALLKISPALISALRLEIGRASCRERV